jgi:tRNA G18 (ribose-2'-O)-methylase SpoU
MTVILDMDKAKEFFVIAHNIRSLYNVGSIFRTSDAFGVSKIFVTGYTGTPEHPKLAKTSLGAETTVPWEYKKSCVLLIKKLKQDYPGIQIIGLENNLPSKYQSKRVYLDKFKPQFPTALILGEEVSGIPANILPHIDQFLEIPMVGQKESLNVVIAFGIAAYEISR